MIYFIPAWYHDNYKREKEQIWFQRKEHTEFDDTVKQIQLFDRNNICNYKILLFSFTPNLRHFLHRQGFFNASYWSVFDAIQGIYRKKVSVFSYKDLKWPDNISFIYTPFCIVAELNGNKYAEIFFGEDGNLIEIHLFKNNFVSRKNYYDDRGFLSNSILYKNGEEYYEQYLNEEGIWKICHFYDDDHIEVNPNANFYTIGGNIYEFSSLYYSSFDKLILEVFSSYQCEFFKNDIFCIAMHRQNEFLLKTALKGKKIITSFYQDRYKINQPYLFKNANYTIIDSQKYSSEIFDLIQNPSDIMELSPFDARVEFGKSSQLDVQNILVPIDDLDLQTFKESFLCFRNYFKKNKKAIVHFFTRKAGQNRKVYLFNLLMETLKENIREQKNWTIDDKNLDNYEIIKSRFMIDQCIDEMSISKIIKQQRILVDLSPYPDLYLQILCISNGIPQIVLHKTQYIADEKNGIVLKNIEQTEQALAFYLDTLYNWNKAKIYSYDLGMKFTTEQLIEKWKKIIKKVEHDRCTID